MGCRRNARKTRKRKGEGRPRKRRKKTKGSRRRRKEEGRRRQEEASHRQHVPPLRWLPPQSREEQAQQTPNRARKEEEDPCRTQKAPQHRPSWNRKDPRKGHRILDRLVRTRRREIRHGTKNHQTKVRHQPTPPTCQRIHGQILQEQARHQGRNLSRRSQVRLLLRSSFPLYCAPFFVFNFLITLHTSSLVIFILPFIILRRDFVVLS